jgi:hypothetical protein
MEDETHLTVIIRHIDEARRLQAEKEHRMCSHSQPLWEDSKRLAVTAASNAKEVKEAQEKLLQDAFVMMGVRVAQIHEYHRFILTY